LKHINKSKNNLKVPKTFKKPNLQKVQNLKVIKKRPKNIQRVQTPLKNLNIAKKD